MIAAFDSVRGRGRIGRMTGADHSAWGVADQALMSASNFVVMILLARELGPKSFGAFTVMYTALLLVNSIHGALFTQPHNIIAISRSPEEFRHYTTVTGWAQFGFSLLIAILLVAAGVVMLKASQSYAMPVMLLAFTCVCWQSQEYFRRVMYTRFDYRGACLNDLVAYGAQAIILLSIASVGSITIELALVVIGATSLLGTVLGFWQLRPYLGGRIRVAQARRDLRETWFNGRWLLASTLASWVSTQLYPLLTAGLVGTAAAGGIRATLNVVAPTHILTKTVDSIAPSRARHAYTSTGVDSLWKYVRRIGLLVGLAIAAYLTVASILAGPLVEFALGSEYLTYSWLVPVLGVSYLITYLGALATIALRAVEDTSPIFMASAISAVLVLTTGVWLVVNYGMTGVGIGMVGQSVVLTFLLWFFAYRKLSSKVEQSA